MEKSYPWKGCGTCLDITGCRFFIAPMCDNYVEKIVGALKHVNTEKIWSGTDATSTVYRGKRIHVLDCVKSCFCEVYDPDTHIVLEATFSKGCPGDSDGDSKLSKDDVLLNNSQRNFPVLSKISFYPLGISDYLDPIAHIVRLAIEMDLYKQSAHYVTILQGDVQVMFDYFDRILTYAENNLSHYVLEATLSVNSPTKEGL